MRVIAGFHRQQNSPLIIAKERGENDRPRRETNSDLSLRLFFRSRSIPSAVGQRGGHRGAHRGAAEVPWDAGGAWIPRGFSPRSPSPPSQRLPMGRMGVSEPPLAPGRAQQVTAASRPPPAHPAPPTNVTRMCNSFLKGASRFPPSPLPAGFSKQREGERGMNKISP